MKVGENMSPSYYNYEKTNTFGDMRFVFVYDIRRTNCVRIL